MKKSKLLDNIVDVLTMVGLISLILSVCGFVVAMILRELEHGWTWGDTGLVAFFGGAFLFFGSCAISAYLNRDSESK